MLNQATVTYYLLLDNRFRTASGYLGAEFQETMVCLITILACGMLHTLLLQFLRKLFLECNCLPTTCEKCE